MLQIKELGKMKQSQVYQWVLSCILHTFRPPEFRSHNFKGTVSFSFKPEAEIQPKVSGSED